MKRSFFLLLPLVGCSCSTGSHQEKVVWTDHSEKSPAWFCNREDGAIKCLDAREVFHLAIEKMPQEMIDQIKLQAPDRSEEPEK